MLSTKLFKIGDFQTVEADKPIPHGEELLIKVSSCGICGSDIPRIYQHGTSNGKYPLTLGHEFGGTIVEVGNEANKNLIGKCGAVFPIIPCNKCEQCKQNYYAMCENYDYLGSRRDGGFSEYCLLPSKWNFIEAPKEIDEEAFALIEPATVAQHAVRTAGKCSSLLIFGAGPIGIMAARWAKIFGINNVILVDIVDEKIDFANKHGVKCVKDIPDTLFDSSIEGTGFGNALGNAINHTKPHGTVVLLGNPASDTQIKLSQHSNILRKELTIKGVWNSYYDEWKTTIEQISNNNLQVLDLITHKSDLGNLPELCRNIYNKNISICKAIAKIVVQ
ncbi:MAG: alcohol dehydrogenase catalytic domain-containing protein [Coriobacteriia bacterium]|nr:alcohol dehydrogenase catalytic domain-containing protein [Coriobacteriia bacterium]